LLGGNDSFSWHENYKLSWKDYKGRPNTNIDAVALTASGITFSYSGTKVDNKQIAHNVLIEARFYPEKSWFKPENVNPHILSHEQLHFDITELYARKFRKRIAETNFTNNIFSEMNKINDKVNQELDLVQNKYDIETNHSINPIMQKKWEEHIHNELKKLLKFRKNID